MNNSVGARAPKSVDRIADYSANIRPSETERGT